MQDGDQKKQYLGFTLASVILDPDLCNLDRSADFFNKSVANPLLQSIFNAIKKHDFDNALYCAALKAFESTAKAVYSFFDAKCHQASLEHFKQIVLTVFKRVENAATQA